MEILKKRVFKIYKGLTINDLIIIILLCFVLLYYIGVVITERNFIFDDSFITYRYAKNLAHGYGITWNPNEQPVEGYTNFLLVLLLAPFIKFGLSPLFVTRILSFTAALGISLLLYRISKKNYNADRYSALFIPVAFLLVSKTNFLAMVGLETVIYTAVLFFTFTLGCKYLDTGQQHYVYLFSWFAFVAFLLRPEAALLVLSLGVIIIIANWNRGMSLVSILLQLGVFSVSFLLPLLIYLVWKYLYFGTVIPNSFLIKVARSEIISSRGLTSVMLFVMSSSILILASLVSFVITKDKYWQRALASLFSLFYAMFFIRVDTLMDIYGRFMYPISVFLVFLSIPTLVLVFQHLLSLKWHRLLKVPFICTTSLLLLSPSTIPKTLLNFNNIIRGNDQYAYSNSLMQREYRVAVALSQYQDIKSMRLAFGDAGVIPYFSDALHLDVVGLNDRFIARETDISKLTNYFFDQQPDLILHPGDKDHSWISYGHGHLGDYTQWSHDERWDNYFYIGTVKTDGSYDIHLFLRRDLPEFERFRTFLQEYVIDGYYNVFPIAIGTYTPSKSIQSIWVLISSGMK